MNEFLSKLQFEVRNIFLTKSDNKENISSMTAYRFTDKQIYMPQTENPY